MKRRTWLQQIGATLALLIDPYEQQAWEYRADGTVIGFTGFDSPWMGSGIMEGFVLEWKKLV